MLKKQLELLEALCEQELNRPLQSCSPEALDGHDTMECLWPLNERFRPRLHQIKTIRYRKQHEKTADHAIRDFVLNNADWNDLPLVTWRVLLERHQQAITLCVANTMKKNASLMFIPSGLSESARTRFAVAFLWYAMKLPYPVTDESALDIDSAFENLSGKLH